MHGVRELGQRCVVRLSNNEVFAGTLFLTNYRLIFICFNRTESAVAPGAQPSREDMQRHFTISIPLMTILKTGVKKSLRLSTGYDWVTPILKVTCKDARRLHFMFDDNLLALLNFMNDTTMEEPDEVGSREQQKGVKQRFIHNQSLREPKGMLGKMFGGGGGAEAGTMSPKETLVTNFHRHLDSIRQINLRKGSFMFESQESDGTWDAERGCWVWGKHWYDAPAEFERQGALSRDSPWRKSELNEAKDGRAAFSFSPTYPQCMLVPKDFTDTELHEVAKFRSKQRLPTLSWFDRTTDTAIIRCAQPLVGITGKKSPADARLFDKMTKANSNGKPLLLVDARPWANALANRGRKGGYEDVSHYEGDKDRKPELVFLNIDNIHVMRASINKMHSLVCSNKRPNNAPVRRTEIFDTGWLTHIGRVLGGCRLIVESTWNRRSSVVHCSDGWDRTAQLCAGSEICLDPYYRTFEGFRVLLQRVWHSYGHKIRDRTWGQVKPDGQYKPDEASPIMKQYLDYCHQLMFAHPKCFEFNEWFLLSLVDCLYKGSSNFFMNTEKEYLEKREGGGTVEYWSFADGEKKAQYVNPRYDEEYSNTCVMPSPERGVTAKKGSIVPPRVARVWEAYFNRYVASPVDGTPWWSADLQPLWSATREKEDADRNEGHTGQRTDGVVAMQRQPGNAESGAHHTLEKISGQGRSSSRPHMVEERIKFEGWLWYTTYSGEQRRWVVFYPSVADEANLVHFEPEESGSLVPKGVIALPSMPDGFPLYTVQEQVDNERLDRFPFDIIVYSSADQRDGTTHSFNAESEEEHMMWVETFKQATRSLGLAGDVSRQRGSVQQPRGREMISAQRPMTPRVEPPVGMMAQAAAAAQAAVASPRITGSGMMGGSPVPRPEITDNGDGTLGLTLHKGQMGFGVNVSDRAVVLDTRSHAEEAGIAKGQVIMSINGTPTPTKTDVHTVLKGSGDSAMFVVKPPASIEARPRRKEFLGVKMKKGWKLHYVMVRSNHRPFFLLQLPSYTYVICTETDDLILLHMR